MRGGRAIVSALILIAGASGTAWASELPRFDVESHCKAVASFGGTYSASLDESCFSMEQAAYDGLKPIWPDLPASVARHCAEVAAFGGPGSYSLLESCIRMEVDAAGANSNRKFKF
ncbi:hypothetical protein WHT83_14845 [Aminobacter sp. P9b]|uniref:hypothetical protein n=1 Tax=Aminobacter sp. P9b TaxID=3133697 RepID=UPI0032506684